MSSDVVLYAAVLTAALTYLYTRSVWAKRAALDFILRYEIHDTTWVRRTTEAIVFLKSLSQDDAEDLAKKWASYSLSASEMAAMEKVVDWLNYMEVVSIGVRSGAIHKRSYLQWNGRTELHRHWDFARPLVDAMRKTDRAPDELYLRFQDFARPNGLPKQR